MAHRLMRSAFVFFIAAMPLAAMASSLQVAPTTIDMQGGARAGLLYVSNDGDKPLVAQIEAFDWTQDDKGEHVAPSASVILSPPMVRLTPGQKQTVRLAVKPEAASGKERAFRLVVSEIPEAAQKDKHDVQMVLQFSVPVFVAGTDDAAAMTVWERTRTAEGEVFTARNIGARHVKLTNISIINSAHEIVAPLSDSLTYILSGSARSWTVALPGTAEGQALHVQAYDEARGAAIDLPVPAMR